jgi:hypothetical protein
VAAVALAGAIPSAAFDASLAQTTIVTTTAGKLFVFGRGFFSLTCISGVSPVEFGLYVDNQAVTASGQPATSGVGEELSVWGVSGVLPAGSHQLALAGDCTSGSYSSASSSGDAAIGAIQLGS